MESGRELLVTVMIRRRPYTCLVCLWRCHHWTKMFYVLLSIHLLIGLSVVVLTLDSRSYCCRPYIWCHDCDCDVSITLGVGAVCIPEVCDGCNEAGDFTEFVVLFTRIQGLKKTFCWSRIYICEMLYCSPLVSRFHCSYGVIHTISRMNNK